MRNTSISFELRTILTDFSISWLTRNEQTRNAHCLMCKRDIRGSLTMIRRHALTGKHMDNVTNYGAVVVRQPAKIAPQNYRLVETVPR